MPISSSGHLAIASRVFFSGDAGASFTAVSQLGTEAAVLVYFARDIWRIVKAWFNGIFVKAHRGSVDYRMGWYVIIGSIPIGVFGSCSGRNPFQRKKSLVTATAMLVFSFVIAAAEYFGRQTRQCRAADMAGRFPGRAGAMYGTGAGVSRSGATISAGLFLGIDRALAARFGFLRPFQRYSPRACSRCPMRSTPSPREMSATGLQTPGVGDHRVRGGLAAITWLLWVRRQPCDVLVRGLSHRARDRRDGIAGHRGFGCDMTPQRS